MATLGIHDNDGVTMTTVEVTMATYVANSALCHDLLPRAVKQWNKIKCLSLFVFYRTTAYLDPPKAEKNRNY
jgi:hypothetical protein